MNWVLLAAGPTLLGYAWQQGPTLTQLYWEKRNSTNPTSNKKKIIITQLLYNIKKKSHQFISSLPYEKY
jgi:hypothetical protein